MFLPNNFAPLLVLLLFCHLTVSAEDHVIGYAHEEPLLIGQSFPNELKEEDLRILPLSSPQLRVIYAFLIRAAIGGPKVIDERELKMVMVLNDLKRRGDSATPLLLDMMEKNHNTSLEELIPLIIAKIGTFKMEPYVDYLRHMIKTRPDEISAGANEIALKIFFDHGTKEDVELVQDLAKKRPFLAPSVERAFEFQRWKHPVGRQATPVTATAQPPVLQSKETQKAPETQSHPSGEEPTLSTPWTVLAVTMLIIAAIGLLWRLLKGNPNVQKK